jgi:predicted RNA-binding protein with TRAM domain
MFLAACSSGGMGDILGGGTPSNGQNYEIRGTVDYVDAGSRSVYLRDVSGYNRSMLSSGSQDSVRVYYDDRTPVTYQGQTYRPQDLERGDVVTVRVDESGNSLVAESMTVVQNVSAAANGDRGNYPVYGSSIRGTVRYIDTSRRTLEVDRGNGSIMTVDYDVNTPVYYTNKTYRVADLERGDEIDLQVRDLGSGRYVAQEINVVRNVSSSGTLGGSPTSAQSSTVRGTVRYVDTSRRTIELDSASWRSGFNSGAGMSGNRIIVSYDTNTSVDVSGRLHPVSGLEVGDVVDVQVSNSSSSTPFAQRILLVRDVNNRY